MEDNPKYAGDYISQAKVEINMFNILLDEKLKQKTDNHEFKLIQEFSNEIPEFHEYSFYHFKKFNLNNAAMFYSYGGNKHSLGCFWVQSCIWR